MTAYHTIYYNCHIIYDQYFFDNDAYHVNFAVTFRAVTARVTETASAPGHGPGPGRRDQLERTFA